MLARPWHFRLEKARAPVRVWQGFADNIVPPAMARRLAAGLALGELHCLLGEGHLSLIVRHLGAIRADLYA